MIQFHQHTIHAAIFDMDGTLFDTETLRFKTLQQASKELTGQEFSNEYLVSCLGLSVENAAALAQQQYGDIAYAEIRQRADQLELEFIREHGVPVKKGLLQVLERLRQSGLRMAVATSSRRSIAEEYLINAGVYKFFDLLVCGDEVKSGKPDPEIFLTAAQQLSVEPEHCLMIEDSANGIAAAHAAVGKTVLIQDIQPPTTVMLQQADYYYQSMSDFLKALERCIPKQEMPSIKSTFPQTLNQLSVGIHGFGAIGGGYLAQIFSHWDGFTRPQKIYASSRNPLYRSAINAFGKYCIRYGELSYDECIEHVQMLDADQAEDMQKMYVESTLIALCLPEQAYEKELATIAKGILAHYQAHGQLNLSLILVINKVQAKEWFLQQLQKELLKISKKNTVMTLLKQLYVSETVVNRMVSKLSDQDLYRQLRIKYQIFKQAQSGEISDEQVDIEEATDLNEHQAEKVEGLIEDLQQNLQASHVMQSMDLILFHAETDMPIYIENNSPQLKVLRQAVLVDNIYDIQLIKNRLWNGVHAMLAWAAARFAHPTMGVAMSDPVIEQYANKLLDQVLAGLNESLPQHAEDLIRLRQSFLDSCMTAFKDPCERIGRDPLRKLHVDERVFGSFIANAEAGLVYDAILKGMILGVVYAIETEGVSETEARQFMSEQIEQSHLSKAMKISTMERVDNYVQAVLQGKLNLAAWLAGNLEKAQNS